LHAYSAVKSRIKMQAPEKRQKKKREQTTKQGNLCHIDSNTLISAIILTIMRREKM
jgi:hypothetical protein